MRPTLETGVVAVKAGEIKAIVPRERGFKNEHRSPCQPITIPADNVHAPTVYAGPSSTPIVVPDPVVSPPVVQSTNACGDKLVLISTANYAERVTADGMIANRIDYAGINNQKFGLAITDDLKSVYELYSSGIAKYNRAILDGALGGSIAYGFGSGGYSAICASPDGLNLYVVSNTTWTVYKALRDPATGALSAFLSYATQNEPNGVIVHPNNLFVYTSNMGSHTISKFTRGTGGALSGRADYATGSSPYGMWFSADGLNLYVANYTGNTVSKFTVDPSTGIPSGRVDYATAAGPIAGVASPDGASVYVACAGADFVCGFECGAGGVLSGRVDYATAANPRDICIHPAGNAVVTANYAGDNLSAFARDAGGGLSARVDVATYVAAGGANPGYAKYSSDGISMYCSYAKNGGGVAKISKFESGLPTYYIDETITDSYSANNWANSPNGRAIVPKDPILTVRP